MGKRLLYVKLQTGAERQPCFKMDLMRTYLQGPKMRVRRGPFVLLIELAYQIHGGYLRIPRALSLNEFLVHGIGDLISML